MEKESQSRQISENPDPVKNLLKMLREPETPMVKIIQQLEELPETSNALLNRANSTEFALKHQISRVSHAIAVLGMQRAEQIVVSQQAHAMPPASHVRRFSSAE